MSIFIALPCYGGVVCEKTTMSLFNLGKLFVREGISHGLFTVANSSLISQGRSKIANFFLNNTDHEYLFFLDSDIGFDPTSVLKLLISGKDITAAPYPMKSIPLRYNYKTSQPEERQGDLIKIEHNGMGFVMIHRKVFYDIAAAYPELKYYPSLDDSNVKPSEAEYHNSYHYFLEHKNGPTFMPEDISFFWRARSLGYECWLDTSIHLSHTGSHLFEEK